MPAYIEAAFPIPLNRGFHYRLPTGFPTPGLGARILAPFGKNKNLVGYVIGYTDEKPSFPTKEIISCLDPEPLVDEAMMQLAKWVSERYLCSLGEALASIIPPNLSAPKRPRAADPELSSKEGVQAQEPAITLNADQERVLVPLKEAISAGRFQPFLLRGITDSGKTEVYLRAMDQVLAAGKQALFLLPEIALTPPFIERLRLRYGRDQVGLWHSGVSALERFRLWTGAHNGSLKVLLGARSAVFAPFSKLGLIVMDEEHEPSYKQDDRPRYHARDVALKRAELTKAILLMGSATPSLEAYWSAKKGDFTLIEMTSRVEQRLLPSVTLVDRRRVSEEPGKKLRRGAEPYAAIFSEPLKLALEQRLARREQAMLFVNRRGFTPFMRCGTCGWVARCPRCSTTMALHMKEDAAKLPARPNAVPVPADALLQCHACLHQEKVPICCPSCKGMRLRHFGIGTQRVEEELKRLFPFVKAGRLDRDAAGARHVYEKIYRDFASGEIDVLVGTQMIAKGFDFPNVTLVGVVDADVSLHLPDFRSAERTFELISQVAGRTGRGDSKGVVLVQTHHPEHYALQAAQSHDYLGFYDQEIRFRETLRYPPFCRLVHILIRGPKEPVVQESAEALLGKLEGLGPGVDLLGPSPAPYSRLRNQFRYQIVLKGTEQTLHPYLSFLRHCRLAKGFMSVDVDPIDLL